MRFTLEPFGEIDIIRSSEGVMHLGHSLNGHRRVLPLNSQEAENYINLVFVEKNIAPTKGEINKTITMLKALSLKVKDTEAINYRYAHLDDNIYINLGDGNHAIKIPKKGEIKPVKNPKAIFTSLEHFEDLNYDRTAKPDFDRLWKYTPPITSFSFQYDTLPLPKPAVILPAELIPSFACACKSANTYGVPTSIAIIIPYANGAL